MALSGPNVFVANSANNKCHFAPEQGGRLPGTMAGFRRQRAEHAGQERLLSDIRACPIAGGRVGRDHKEPASAGTS